MVQLCRPGEHKTTASEAQTAIVLDRLARDHDWVTPDYTRDPRYKSPEATELVWAWLHASDELVRLRARYVEHPKVALQITQFLARMPAGVYRVVNFGGSKPYPSQYVPNEAGAVLTVRAASSENRLTEDLVVQLVGPGDCDTTASEGEMQVVLNRLLRDHGWLRADTTTTNQQAPAAQAAADKAWLLAADELVRLRGYYENKPVPPEIHPGSEHFRASNNFRKNRTWIPLPTPRREPYSEADVGAAGEVVYVRDMGRHEPFALVNGCVDRLMRVGFQRGHCHAVLYAGREVFDWRLMQLLVNGYRDHFAAQIEFADVKPDDDQLFFWDAVGVQTLRQLKDAHSRDLEDPNSEPVVAPLSDSEFLTILNAATSPGMFQIPIIRTARRAFPTLLYEAGLVALSDEAERLLPNRLVIARPDDSATARRLRNKIDKAIYQDAARVVVKGAETLGRRLALEHPAEIPEVARDLASAVKQFSLATRSGQPVTRKEHLMRLGALRGIMTRNTGDAEYNVVTLEDFGIALGHLSRLEDKYRDRTRAVVGNSLRRTADVVSRLLTDTEHYQEIRQGLPCAIPDAAQALGIQLSIDPQSKIPTLTPIPVSPARAPDDRQIFVALHLRTSERPDERGENRDSPDTAFSESATSTDAGTIGSARRRSPPPVPSSAAGSDATQELDVGSAEQSGGRAKPFEGIGWS